MLQSHSNIGRSINIHPVSVFFVFSPCIGVVRNDIPFLVGVITCMIDHLSFAFPFLVFSLDTQQRKERKRERKGGHMQEYCRSYFQTGMSHASSCLHPWFDKYIHANPQTASPSKHRLWTSSHVPQTSAITSKAVVDVYMHAGASSGAANNGEPYISTPIDSQISTSCGAWGDTMWDVSFVFYMDKIWWGQRRSGRIRVLSVILSCLRFFFFFQLLIVFDQLKSAGLEIEIWSGTDREWWIISASTKRLNSFSFLFFSFLSLHLGASGNVSFCRINKKWLTT